MELTDTQDIAIQNRLAQLSQMRARLIEQANLELARIDARIDELRLLLQGDADEQPGPAEPAPRL
jgi:hypothetical protein